MDQSSVLPPGSIRDLIGRKCRIVEFGEVVTQEVDPGRISIYLNSDSTISDIKIDDRPVPILWAFADMPSDIRSLIGRKCRSVGPEDAVTQKIIPGYILIYFRSDGTISDIKN